MPGRDPNHWLLRFSPDEWLRAGMRELRVAKESFSRHAARPGLASARRAAGMGWNAVLALEESPDTKFGRTYAEHLVALAEGQLLDATDPTPIPEVVRVAARRLLDDPAAGHSEVVQILTPRRDGALLEAAETILAEALSRVVRRRPLAPQDTNFRPN
jgi:hypothetical protein